MLTISKPLSAGRAQTYHREEFANARENYYSEGERIRGEWHGKLAEEWGLRGEVHEMHFQRLSEGQHPITGEQLVRHQTAREYTNDRGEVVKTMEHRAGWDATFSAPKSVSLTALVGGDERVRAAHRESVRVALDEMERYVQARIGGSHPAETTGKWIAAKFEHDSARPVDGYAAPQLHTHIVFLNLTETQSGDMRALQPLELYRTQQYATAVYRSELAHRLREMGYEIERGKSGQPEIKGYSQEYLEASSPRRRQIKEHLEQQGLYGAGAAQIAAHRTREKKLAYITHEEMRAKNQEMAEAFGNQPERVVLVAKERAHQIEHNRDTSQRRACSAATFSRDRNPEREAVAGERALFRDALKRSMGETTFAELKTEFEKRIKAGEFIEVQRETGAPDRVFTTGEMISHERDTITVMRAGQNKYMASTKQMNELLHRLGEHDRVLLVGDVRQRQAVEAGRPYQQLQEAGIETARLDEIARENDPALKAAVAQLSRGEVREAFLNFDRQARVHEIVDRDDRLKEIAREYTRQPEGTLVVSPDNQSRIEINDAIHREMQGKGLVDQREYSVRVLVARQEITGADRQWAGQYKPEDVVHYTKGSKTFGIKAGEYATVESVDAKQNQITVEKENGETAGYDPRRLYGVTLYHEAERAFSAGDRVQFTAPYRELHVASRELGTIDRIDDSGNVAIRLDSGREVAFNIRGNPHLDHGYAVTSHSGQGQTADRVLMHVDTERGGKQFVNSRLAYVAVSCGRYDAQIYTDDKVHLAEGLGREFSKQSAIELSSGSDHAHQEEYSQGQSVGH